MNQRPHATTHFRERAEQLFKGLCEIDECKLPASLKALYLDMYGLTASISNGEIQQSQPRLRDDAFAFLIELEANPPETLTADERYRAALSVQSILTRGAILSAEGQKFSRISMSR